MEKRVGKKRVEENKMEENKEGKVEGQRRGR